MRLFSKKNVIAKIDYEKFYTAMLFQCFYMFLNKPRDKTINDYHCEAYGYIDLKFKNENNEYVIVQYKVTDIKGCYQLLIHQKGKPAVDLNKALKGYDKFTIDWYINKAQLPEYGHNTPFYNHLITAASYFYKDKLYSGMKYNDFMNNGGNNIAHILNCIVQNDFPLNLHDLFKNKLHEKWQKDSYDDLVESLKTKEFDIFKSSLHEHITKEQFKYFERYVLEGCHIKVINKRKKNLWKD